MFLSINTDTLIKKENIIGIFDMDTATVSPVTRAFLRKSERDKQLKNVSSDIPKSFVITDDNVFLVKNSPLSLKSKSENIF